MKKIIITRLLSAMLLGSALINVGCQAIDDFQEDNPVAYDVLTGAAKLALLSQVPAITDDVVYQQLLNATIDGAFLAANTPNGVAAELQSGVANVYPGDALMQQIAVQEFVQALNAPSDSTVPASGPDTAFKRALADALRPAVVTDYSFDPVYSVTLAREL